MLIKITKNEIFSLKTLGRILQHILCYFFSKFNKRQIHLFHRL